MGFDTGNLSELLETQQGTAHCMRPLRSGRPRLLTFDALFFFFNEAVQTEGQRKIASYPQTTAKSRNYGEGRQTQLNTAWLGSSSTTQNSRCCLSSANINKGTRFMCSPSTLAEEQKDSAGERICWQV